MSLSLRERVRIALTPSRVDVVRVAPHTVRAFEAGPDGLELIAICSDRPEEGDGVLVQDWWTDH